MDIVKLLRSYARRDDTPAMQGLLMREAAKLLSDRPLSCKDCGYVEKDTSLMQCSLIFGHPVVDDMFYCAKWMSKEFFDKGE